MQIRSGFQLREREVLLYVSGDKPTVIKGTRADLPWFYTPMTLVALASCLQFWPVSDHPYNMLEVFKDCHHLNESTAGEISHQPVEPSSQLFTVETFDVLRDILEVSAVLWLAALSKERVGKCVLGCRTSLFHQLLHDRS